MPNGTARVSQDYNKKVDTRHLKIGKHLLMLTTGFTEQDRFICKGVTYRVLSSNSRCVRDPDSEDKGGETSVHRRDRRFKPPEQTNREEFETERRELGPKSK